MYYNVNIIILGTLVLIMYIFVDFIKNRTKNVISRIFFYSFIFYLLNIAQLATGGIIFPPQKSFVPEPQLIPFYFIIDGLSIFKKDGLDWNFRNHFRLSFYNFLMLMPLGVFLSLLYKTKRVLKATLIIFLVSLTIEIFQPILGYLGFINGRKFNVDDLILNTLGGVIGFLLMEYLVNKLKFERIEGNKESSLSSF